VEPEVNSVYRGRAPLWGGASAVRSEPHPAYQALRDAMAERRASFSGTQPGPDDTTAAVFAAIDAENPPKRLLLSGTAFDIAQNVYVERVKTWSEWEATSRSA